MNVSVIGTGYVGLVTGVCFAETGNEVVCVDIDPEKVRTLNDKVPTIYEPGIEVLLKRNVEQGRLSFTTELQTAVDHADVLFLALPTPPGGDGAADLSYVLNSAREIAGMLTDYLIIVDKSTVPVGTADEVRAIMAAETDVDFDVVSNPEFLREGFAVEDFLKPERVVIGTSSERARETMDHLYRPFVRQGNPVIFMDERSAEMTKYAANSFLATKISFMNEVANLCEMVGADVDQVRRGIGTDSRIGKRFLFPGIGYGGSCFPKDVKALKAKADEVGYDFRILKAVMDVNQGQRERFVHKVLDHYDGDLDGVTVAMWGLSFKPNTDDIREAPSLYVIEALLERGATVAAFDPEAMDNVRRRVGDRVTFVDSMYDALDDADVLLILTEWTVFRSPDFDKMKERLKAPLIFDGRNVFDLDEMREQGFVYRSIGRTDVEQ